MRDYKKEFEGRVAFIRKVLEESGAAGIVFGNSGGKDSALVGILCKAACENTVYWRTDHIKGKPAANRLPACHKYT